MSVRERTARLTAGRLSEETHPALRDNPPPLFSTPPPVPGRHPHRLSWIQSGGEGGGLDGGQGEEEEEEETVVVTRPQWQAFVLLLQLQHPEVGGLLAPALQIGQDPPVRVILEVEVLSLLSQYTLLWYGKEVEVITVSTRGGDWERVSPLSEAVYLQPYRPVTGLPVIVTRTFQRSAIPRESRILEEKERWTHQSLFTNLRSAYNLTVEEREVRISPREREVRKGVRRDGTISGFIRRRLSSS